MPQAHPKSRPEEWRTCSRIGGERALQGEHGRGRAHSQGTDIYFRSNVHPRSQFRDSWYPQSGREWSEPHHLSGTCCWLLCSCRMQRVECLVAGIWRLRANVALAADPLLSTPSCAGCEPRMTEGAKPCYPSPASSFPQSGGSLGPGQWTGPPPPSLRCCPSRSPRPTCPRHRLRRPSPPKSGERGVRAHCPVHRPE
jgi:hypothetical protein